MDGLVEWLLEQIQTDERIAQAAVLVGTVGWKLEGSGSGIERNVDEEYEILVYDEGAPEKEESVHIVNWDPARVLAECDVKYQIVRMYKATRSLYRANEARIGSPHSDAELDSLIRSSIEIRIRLQAFGEIIELLALRYVVLNRPGFKQEWRS